MFARLIIHNKNTGLKLKIKNHIQNPYMGHSNGQTSARSENMSHPPSITKSSEGNTGQIMQQEIYHN